MKLNPELINKRCREIEESLERLKKIKKSSKEEFLKNRDLQDIASYRLLVSIEAALDLCYHVSAKKLKKVPNEYGECFEILGDDLDFFAMKGTDFILSVQEFREQLEEKGYKVITYGFSKNFVRFFAERAR